MSEAKARPKRVHPIALSMKAIGYLTSPESLPGKAFVAYEKGLTSAFDWLAQNDAYLNFAGRMMKLGFQMRRETTKATEAWLHFFHLPTERDVSSLRGEVRAVHDEIEALGAQLEALIDATEKANKDGGKS